MGGKRWNMFCYGQKKMMAKAIEEERKFREVKVACGTIAEIEKKYSSTGLAGCLSAD